MARREQEHLGSAPTPFHHVACERPGGALTELERAALLRAERAELERDELARQILLVEANLADVRRDLAAILRRIGGPSGKEGG